MNRKILIGDVLEKIKEIPAESIDCIITSPPYWGLRDYQVDGQWGLEEDFKDYLANMQKLMNELKRVLKKSGSCWINLGDTYSSSGGENHKGQSGLHGENCNCNSCTAMIQKTRMKMMDITSKSRYGIPERFYINCIDNGWIARNHIPWYKANSMPSSVKDRFTNKWESIFFFVKNKKYYFNLDAVRENPISEKKPSKKNIEEEEKGQMKLNDKIDEMNKKTSKQDSTLGADGKPKANYKGFNERWKNEKELVNKGYCDSTSRIQSRFNATNTVNDSRLPHVNGKNGGDVFFINPQPFPEAHFATFPVALPLKILKCACPDQICVKCGKPREKIFESQSSKNYSNDSNYDRQIDVKHGLEKFNRNSKKMESVDYKFNGYTDCGCGGEFISGLVLDPFFGAGTTGVAAEMLGLRWIGIELKEEYAKIAQKRLDKYKNERL